MRSARHLLAATVAIALTGCGAGAHPRATPAAPHRRGHPDAAAIRVANERRGVPVTPTGPEQLGYRRAYALPAPLRDPAAVTLGGGRFALLGGLSAADSSVAGIELGDRRHLISTVATLPEAQHDAQGAALGGSVYVFGGGSLSELDHVVRYDPAGQAVATVGRLPSASSDVAVSALNGTAYVFGGYDGTNWLTTILAYRPGSRIRVAGHLPIGLRYAATAAAGGRILVIGGTTPTGVSDAIYAFDPATGVTRTLGRLSRPVTHATAAALGGEVYLIGGRGDSDTSQTAAIWAIDPRSGHITRAGRLPIPLSDAGVAAVGDAIVVAGGLESSGGVSGAVGTLTPRAPRATAGRR